MPDREKIIKDLEECLSASCRGFRPRLSCPYNDEEWDIMRDALAMLKEYETTDTNDLRVFHCKKCGYGIEDIFISDEHNYSLVPKFCPNCGRKVGEAKMEMTNRICPYRGKGNVWHLTE